MELLMLVLALGGLGTDSFAIHTVLMFLHLCFGTYMAWKLKATQPLTAIMLLCYGPMYYLNPMAIMVGLIPEDSPVSALIMSNALMMAGMDLFIFGARRLRFTKADLNKLPPMKISEGRLDIAIIIALSIYALMSSVQVLGVQSLDANKSAFDFSRTENAVGGAQSIYFLLGRYASMALPFAGFFVALKKPRKQVPYLVPLMALLMLNFLLYRVRQAPIAVAQGYVIGTIAKYLFVTVSEVSLSGTLPKALRVGMLVMIPVIGLSAIGIRWVRAMYTTGNYDFSQESVQRITESTFTAGDLSVSYMTRKAVEKFPAEHEYLSGLSIYRYFLAPVPRFIWPDKPQPTQRIFAEIIFPEKAGTGLTVPAGVAGDLYVNFGPFGVIGMVFIGFLFSLERYRTLMSLLILASCGLWIFHFARGSQTVPAVVLIVTSVVAYGFRILLAPQPTTAAGTNPVWYYYWVPNAAAVMPGGNPAGPMGKLKSRPS